MHRLRILLVLLLAALILPQAGDARSRSKIRQVVKTGEKIYKYGKKQYDEYRENKESKKKQQQEVVDYSEARLWAGIGLPATSSNLPSKILHRTGYATSYNRSTLLPNWTAWCLTAEHTSGSSSRKGISYTEDNSVSPSATYDDWSDAAKLNFDHGHMCPAGDNKWSAKAMTETFLLTNMCPQVSQLNQRSWEHLESASRKWANRLGKLYIVCGPIYKSSKHRKMGKGNVHVPDAFYKVFLYMGNGKDEPRAIGFVYDNVVPKTGDNMQDHVVPISEIERMTGITFFPELPKNTAQKLKNVTQFKQWNKF